MQKNLFYIISPCVIVTVMLCIGMIKDTAHGGWSMLGVLAGLPLLCVVLVIGVITKLLIRKNNLLLWVVEIGMLVLSFLVLIKFGK